MLDDQSDVLQSVEIQKTHPKVTRPKMATAKTTTTTRKAFRSRKKRTTRLPLILLTSGPV